MAYEDSYLMDEEEKRKREETPTIAGGSSIIGANVPSPEGGVPRSSGRFQNLQDYLKANQGSQFGSQFAGKVSADIGQAPKEQQRAYEQFKQRANEAGAPYNYESQVAETLANPTQEKAPQYQKLLAGQYGGPKSLSDISDAYQRAYGATQKAQNVGKAAQTEGGRFALLGDYFGAPKYTRGQKTLDNLLLQGSAQTGESLASAKRQADAAKLQFQTMQPELSNYAAGKIGQVQQAQKYAQEQGGKAIEAENQKISDALRAGKISEARATGYAQDLAAGRVTPELLSILTEQPHTLLYEGVNPTDFYKQQFATASNVSSPQTQARLNALENIMGNPKTAFEAGVGGTFNPNRPFEFNKAGFTSALDRKWQGMQAEYANKISSAENAFGGLSGLENISAEDRKLPLPELLQKLQPGALLAAKQLQAGGNRGTFGPAVRQYENVRQKLSWLQGKYGHNDRGISPDSAAKFSDLSDVLSSPTGQGQIIEPMINPATKEGQVGGNITYTPPAVGGVAAIPITVPAVQTTDLMGNRVRVPAGTRFGTGVQTQSTPTVGSAMGNIGAIIEQLRREGKL